jgi:hypothetical protein
LVLYLRGEPQRALLGTIFFSHAAAWLCCRATERSPDQGRARAFNQSPRLLAHAFGLLSWAAHTMVGGTWSTPYQKAIRLHEVRTGGRHGHCQPIYTAVVAAAAGTLQVMLSKEAGLAVSWQRGAQLLLGGRRPSCSSSVSFALHFEPASLTHLGSAGQNGCS